MSDALPDVSATVFAKTEAGQQEIKTRALGLSPRLRSVLIMVDGRRTGQDLAAMTGPDAPLVLAQLLERGCVEVIAAAPPPAAAPAAAAAVPEASTSAVPGAAPGTGASSELAGLPPAESRSAKEIEMARNFMTNTINTMFGQNMRLSLIEEIFKCQSAQALRQVYPHWAAAMHESRAGAKRLPELTKKLFEVL